MTTLVPYAAMQAAVAQGEIETIAWAQVVMAVSIVVLLLLAIAGALLSYNTMRALGRLIKEMENVMQRLVPRAEPLIDGATKLATDLAAVTQSVRGEVDEMRATLTDVNRRLRQVTEEAEKRVSRFGHVLGVVQEETEDLLMSAAATARGLHTAADALRSPEPGLARRARRAEMRARRPLDTDFEDFDDFDDEVFDDDEDLA